MARNTKKSRSRRQTKSKATRKVRAVVKVRPVAEEIVVAEPVTDVVTEKTYVTTEPEVEIRKPGTLAQALTQPPVAVVKPKKKVRKEVVSRTRRTA